jgi:DNA-binding MarR family transcriptional regulator
MEVPMRSEQEEFISENAMLLFPFAKRLFKTDSSDPALVPFHNQSFPVLSILKKRGPLPISEIGKLHLIAKQNMTIIVDRLVREGLVERKNDEKDRRVIKVEITKKGTGAIEVSRMALKDIIKKNLSILTDNDIDALHTALYTVQIILSKMEPGDCHARTRTV